MKKLLIALLALAMLCSCQNTPNPAENDTPPTGVTEATEGDTSPTEPPESQPESQPENDSADDAEQKLTGTRQLDLKQFSKEPDDQPLGMGYCGGNTVSVEYRRDGSWKYVLAIDIAKNEVVADIPIPEGYYANLWGGYIDFEKETGGDEQVETDYKRMKLNPDGSYEWLEGEFDRSISPVFSVGSHEVYQDYGSIIDVGTKAPIIKRYTEEDDEYGVKTLNYRVMFPLDDERFVYRIDGYEQMPGFGIYDFTTGEATDIPDTRDMMPLGYCGGKILSNEACWDGYGTKLFVTDPESFETVLFCEPFEDFEMNEYVDFTMSEDMKYVSACLIGEDFTRCLILNPETAETVSEFSFDAHYHRPFFTDDYLFFEDPTAAMVCMITDRP